MSIAAEWKIPMLGLAALLCLSFGSVTAASADEPSIPVQVGAKLGRGVVNLATGFGELPKQIYLVGQKEGWAQGAFRGLLEGLGMFIARTATGLYEVVTFPIPVPSGYQPVLLPEYVWQPEPASQLTVPTESAAPMLKPDNR